MLKLHSNESVEIFLIEMLLDSHAEITRIKMNLWYKTWIEIRNVYGHLAMRTHGPIRLEK